MASKAAEMEAIISIGGELKPSVKKAINNASKEVNGLGKKLSAAGNAFKSFEKAALVAGAALTTAVAGAAVYGAKKLVDLAGEFQEATNIIRIGTGATGDALKDLENSFNKVYATLPLSKEAVATAIADINTLTGATGEALETFTHRALDAADMLQVDAKGLYTAAAHSFNAFGIAAEDMGDMLDYVWKVSQSTGAGMQEMMDIVQKNQTTFRSLGYTYEQSIALIGQMDKAGFEATDAMSALQKAVANMAKAGVKDMGKGLQNAINKIKNAKTESEAAALAIEAFGARGGAKMAKGIRDGTIAVDDLVAAMKASPESIDVCADATDTFADKWQEFKNGIEVGLRPALDAITNMMTTVFIPMLNDLAAQVMPQVQAAAEAMGAYITENQEAIKQKIIEVAQSLRDGVAWIIQNRDMLADLAKKIILVYAGIKTVQLGIAIWKGMATAITAVKTAYTFLTAAETKNMIASKAAAAAKMTATVGMKAYAAAQWLMNAAMAACPIVLVIAGIVALVAAVIWLWKNWDKVVQWLSEAWEWLCDAVMTAWDAVADFLSAYWKFVKKSWKAVFKALGAAWDWLCDALKAAWNYVVSALASAWETIKARWKAVFKAIGAAWDWLCGALKAAWNAVAAFLTEYWENCKAAWKAVFEALGAAWDWLCNAFKTAWDFVASALSAAWEHIKSSWLAVFDAIGAAWDFVCNGFKSAWESVKSYFATAVNWLSGIFTNLWNGIKSAFTTVFNALPAAIKTPINAVINLINGAINAINGIGFTIPDFVPGLGGKTFAVSIPNIPMLAAGGFTDGISIAGEAGTEAVISFDPAHRKENQGYLMTAAEMLGMFAAPKQQGGSTTYNLGGVTFQPVIKVGDNANRSDILRQLRACMPDFLDMLESEMNNREAHRYV